MKLRLSALAVIQLVSLVAGGANFPIGTYVYTGSVLNYKHEVMSSADRMTIQAVATNGTVLASCRVIDPVVSSGRNFVLEVPVSTEASAKSAAIGDELNCVLVAANGTTNVSLRPLPVVAKANAITSLSVVSASTTQFVCGDHAVLVADDYLAGLAPYMQAAGKAEYDPAADWDGDGAPNYNEYLAGTNPFDPSDRLRITAFSAPGTTATLLTFEYAGGHLYALDSTPSLTNKTWAATAFRVESHDAPEQKTVSVPGTEYEDVGEMTLHLAPAADAPSMFYAIRAE